MRVANRRYLQYRLITPVGRAHMQSTAVSEQSPKLKPTGGVRAGDGRRFI